jgi:Zn-dependent protease
VTSDYLLQRALMFSLILPAIVLHEISHGYVAYRLGDTTAKDAGRLSLNPLKHIDLWGTILLPLLMVAMFGFGFGYAKPVPINPNRFKNYREGMFLTGLAGPTTNLLLAVAAGLGVRLFAGVGLSTGAMGWITLGLYYFCLMNLSLMFFNLIPLPPLDGSRVLPLFLSDRAMVAYAKAEQYGFIILFAILWIAPKYLGFDPIGAYFNATVEPLLRLFTGQG